MFDETDMATWGALPMGYDWRTVDHVTGECHLFAPDGRNLSVAAGVPDPGPFAPQTAVNAAIVAAMLDHPYMERYADRKWAQWCDMTPVVIETAPGSDPLCPEDVWWVLVQYSSKGGCAAYGVDRNNVPQCYAD